MNVEHEIELIKARLLLIESRGGASGGAGSTTGGKVATSYDLDGEYGDPIVKKDPKRWTGESFAGCKMSECPPDYLEEVASLFDWMADRDDEQGKTWTSKKPGATPKPASTFKRKDASLARGWALRKRVSASRYGVSGTGNSAKHALPPHDADGVVGDGEFEEDSADQIPF